MSSDKSLIIWGLLGKVESTYGSYNTPSTSADGIQVAEMPDYTQNYAYDGSRARPPGTRGLQVRLAPNGRTADFTIKTEGKGSGSAYSSSVKPRDNSVLHRISGLDETGSFGGGAEKYTYTPSAGPGSFSSGSLEFYLRGEKYTLNGCYASMSWEASNGGAGIFTYTGKGRVNAAYTEDTSTAKTIVYAPTIIPPVVAPLNLSINGVTTLVCRSARINFNRAIDERVSLGVTGGHGGFHPGLWEPELVVMLEHPLFATSDLWTLRNSATVFAATMSPVGASPGTQYNRYKWTFAQAQIKDLRTSAEGAIPMTEVAISLHCSTGILNDDISLVYD